MADQKKKSNLRLKIWILLSKILNKVSSATTSASLFFLLDNFTNNKRDKRYLIKAL